MEKLTEVRWFSLEDKGLYRHMMDISNDHIYLKETTGRTLLDFTPNCQVFTDVYSTKQKTLLGNFSIQENFWIFTTTKGKVIKGLSSDLPEGLLDFEIEISKKFLLGEL